MKKQQLTILILLIPIMSIAQVFDCGNLGGGYFKISANSGLNLRKAPDQNSDKLFGIPFGSIVFCCILCESYPNEIIEGNEGCWKKIFFENHEGYVFSGFLEALPKIDLMCPIDWINEWKNPIFKKNIEYYGIYEDDRIRRKSKAIKIEGKDTLIESPAMGKIRMIKVEGMEAPEFIVSNLSLKDRQQINGRHFDNKMLYPGEMVGFGKSYLYATGIPQTNDKTRAPFSSIKDYRLILRRLSDDGENYEEVILFNMDIPHFNGVLYVGGVHLRWVGDLDNDDEIDVLLTYSTHYACWDVILLLSSKAMGNKLIGEAVRYSACGC